MNNKIKLTTTKKKKTKAEIKAHKNRKIQIYFK